MKAVTIVFVSFAVLVVIEEVVTIVSGPNTDPIRIVAASTIGMVLGLVAIATAILAKKKE